MPQILMFNDDGSFEDVTEQVHGVVQENDDLLTQLGEIQLSHPDLVLGASTGATGSAQVAAASKAAGKVTPRGSAAIAAASKAAGKVSATPVAAGAGVQATQASGTAAKAGRMGHRAKKAGAASLGKHVMHAGKVAVRFGKKHKALGAAAAAGAAGGVAANALKSKLGLSHEPLELETELEDDIDVDVPILDLDELDVEDQFEVLSNVEDDDVRGEMIDTLPEEQQEELYAYERQAHLSDFASNILANDALSRIQE